ncbi:MAG: GntR family transcriptional regulator [Granulosicoccus sp.]
MELKLAEQIADTLEQSVFSGEYSDGERLDEIKIAQQFEVSRTPVREAFQRLVITGLAEQIPRRGVFIRLPGPVELLEMFETMAELEAACGRLAAQRISEDGLNLLSVANEKCQKAAEMGDVSGYYLENEKFHQEIYEGAGNSFLQGKALRLQNRLKPYRRVQLQFRGRMLQSLDEHDNIVNAITVGDADKASNLLRDHVTVQGEKFQQLVTSLKSTTQNAMSLSR